MCCSGKRNSFIIGYQRKKSVKGVCYSFEGMNESSVMVSCDLCLLAVYLLQQQQTGISTSARVRWINSASIFSASGSGWFITAISSVSDEWWMSIYTKAATTGHFIALFFFSLYDLLTVWARARRKVSRRLWFNCVHVCQISQSVCDLHLLLYAGKVTAAVLSQGWFHEVIPCANGWIDGVTSVDAY